MPHGDFQDTICWDRMSYISVLSHKCEKMAFFTGLNLNQRPLFLPWLLTLCLRLGPSPTTEIVCVLPSGDVGMYKSKASRKQGVWTG